MKIAPDDSVVPPGRRALVLLSERGVDLDTMDVKEDHVHIFLEALPKYSAARVAQILKSISGREIFHRFPWLRQQLWGGEMGILFDLWETR